MVELNSVRRVLVARASHSCEYGCVASAYSLLSSLDGRYLSATHLSPPLAERRLRWLAKREGVEELEVVHVLESSPFLLGEEVAEVRAPQGDELVRAGDCADSGQRAADEVKGAQTHAAC